MRFISWLERFALDSIVMKASPLLESILGSLVIFLGIPVQHFGAVLDADLLAIGRYNALRVVEQIVCINDSDADLAIRQFAMLARESGADLLLLGEKVEDTAQLVVASFGRHEIVETSDLIQGWNSASPVRWNAVAWVADEKCEVKLLQDFCRNDGRIARLSSCGVWVRSLGVMAVGLTIGMTIGHAIGLLICPYAFLDGLSAERWCDCGRLAIGRNQIVGDILDEESLPLHCMSFCVFETRDRSRC